MRKCNTCKLESEDSFFTKFHKFEFVGYFKLCYYCREKCRAANERRKEKKSQQSKEFYQQNKDTVTKRNKNWREKNKDKLREYEKSDFRKQKNKEWREHKRAEDRFRFVWYAAKRRAKTTVVPFMISKQDIIDIFPLDGKCPMLDIQLQFNNKKSQDDSPSLDRIIPELGYVVGNIRLISYRANRIKNDATLKDLKMIVAYLDKRNK